jgi:hypothetical protein
MQGSSTHDNNEKLRKVVRVKKNSFLSSPPNLKTAVLKLDTKVRPQIFFLAVPFILASSVSSFYASQSFGEMELAVVLRRTSFFIATQYNFEADCLITLHTSLVTPHHADIRIRNQS